MTYKPCTLKSQNVYINMQQRILAMILLSEIVTAMDGSYIDLLSPYKEMKRTSENKIGYGRTHIVSTSSLYATRRQFSDLRKLVEAQMQILASLVVGQKKLIRDKSRYGKWNKYTRKYLKKIYKSCMCEARASSSKYHPPNRKSPAIFDKRSKSDNYVRIGIPNTSDVMLNDPESQNDGFRLEDEKILIGQESEAKLLDLDIGLDISNQRIGNSTTANGTQPMSEDTKHSNLGPEKLSHSEEIAMSTANASSSTPAVTTMTPVTSATSVASATVSVENNEDANDSDGIYDISVNLKTGVINGNHSDITWLVYPTDEATTPCGQQGLVRLNFQEPSTNQSHEKIMIDIWFDTPEGWVFNVGDSKSNDGGSGDGTAQENDSEAQGYGTSFSVHSSDKSPNPYTKLLFKDEYFIKSRVTLIVSNESIVWNNHAGNFNFIKSPTLFALNNQTDNQGPANYDLYMSLNRVIAGNYRSGRGLCKISLKWLD